MNDTLASDPQNHRRKRKATYIILILRKAMNGSVGIFMKIVPCVTATDDLSRPSSWVFLEESKVSCSRAKPTKLSLDRFLELKKIVLEWNQGEQGWMVWHSLVDHPDEVL